MTVDDLSTINDDDLVESFSYWFRVYRNEETLMPAEREYFRRLLVEMKRRGLLKI